MSSQVVAALNQLLEAERAGVETLAALKAQHPDSALGPGLDRLHKDEAWSCAGLARSAEAYGGPVSGATGDFAAKVLALPTLAQRLELLIRGQQWVVRKVDALLETEVEAGTVSFLREMKEVHRRNVEWCQRQLEALK